MLAAGGYHRASEQFSLFPEWLAKIHQWKTRYPLDFKDTDNAILPQHVIRLLYELTNGEAIITTGVGQHQMWAAQYYKYKYPRQLLTSAGLGAMGYGYPAALGAKVACPDGNAEGSADASAGGSGAGAAVYGAG